MSIRTTAKTFIHHSTTLLRIIVAVLVLWWLFRTGKFDFSVLLASKTGQFRFSIWYLSVVLVPVSLCLLAFRWQQFLSLQGIHIGFRTSLRLTLVANFFMVALPGMIGGDVVKIVSLCKSMQSRRLNAVSATLMDRVFGTYALFGIGTFAAVCFLFFRQFGGSEIKDPTTLSRVLLIPPVLFLGATAILAVAMNQVAYTRFVVPILVRIPAGEYLHRVLETINMHGRHLGKVSWLVAISLLIHLVNIIVIMCVAQAVQDPLSPLTHFLLNPIGLTGNLIPITPGGIGLTEGIFQYLYSSAGSDYGATIGLISRLLRYIVFVGLGFPVFVFMRSSIVVRLAREESGV